MNKKSIIIVGPHPPPIGGVSIHVSRLITKLKDIYQVYTVDSSQKLKVIPTFLKILVQALYKPSKYIVHNHIFKIKINALIILICKLFRVKYVQTIHSFRTDRIDNEKLSNIKLILIKFIINNADQIIVVNNKIKDEMIKIESKALYKICVVPAFIPYDKKEVEAHYLDNLEIETFVSNKKILLCANAYKISFYKNEDLYGLDLCIELIKKIKKTTNYDVGMIFMLPQIGDESYFNIIKKRISDYEIDTNFIFVNKEVDLVPLFKYVDIFIRPTNTDGDALSIREALYSGIPTIASDVIERPSGTNIFKNRNSDDLFEKVMEVIRNLDQEKIKAKEYGSKQENYIKSYIELFDRI